MRRKEKVIPRVLERFALARRKARLWDKRAKDLNEKAKEILNEYGNFPGITMTTKHPQTLVEKKAMRLVRRLKAEGLLAADVRMHVKAFNPNAFIENVLDAGLVSQGYLIKKGILVIGETKEVRVK